MDMHTFSGFAVHSLYKEAYMKQTAKGLALSAFILTAEVLAVVGVVSSCSDAAAAVDPLPVAPAAEIHINKDSGSLEVSLTQHAAHPAAETYTVYWVAGTVWNAASIVE